MTVSHVSGNLDAGLVVVTLRARSKYSLALAKLRAT